MSLTSIKLGSLPRRSTAGSDGLKSKGDTESRKSRMKLFDEDGNDLTPLPMILEDKKMRQMEKENMLDPSVLQLSSMQHHGPTFSKSILSVSNPFMDSTSDGSDDHTLKKDSTLEEKSVYSAQNELKSVDLDANVSILVTESETFWLFDQQPSFLVADSEWAPYQIKRNAAYQALCAARLGNDRYIERAMNTTFLPTIVKMLQTNEILYADKCVMASVHDVWDEHKKMNQAEKQTEESYMEADKGSESSEFDTPKPLIKNKDLLLRASDVPNAVSRREVDYTNPIQLAAHGSLGSANVAELSLSDRTTSQVPFSSRSDDIITRSGDVKHGVSVSTNKEDEDLILIQRLHDMERALNMNTFFEKLTIYKSVLLKTVVSPPSVIEDDTDLSATFAAVPLKKDRQSTTTDEKSEGRTSKHGSVKGSQRTAILRGHTPPGIKIEKNSSKGGHSGTEKATSDPTAQARQLTPADSRSGKSGGGAGQQIDGIVQTPSQTVAALPTDMGMEFIAHVLPPDLSLLWKFNCHLTKGRNVSDIAFNRRKKDILAVGYGQFLYDGQRVGMVCCWSLKNIGFPERYYVTPSGVTAVAWSSKNDNLLAVGMFSGVIMIFDARKKTNVPIIDTTHVNGRNYGPIRKLTWIVREAGRSAGNSESLISLSMDGRISEWFVLKGFDCTGECDFHVDLMMLKRPSHRGSGVKPKKKRTEALIARHAVGSALAFNISESNIYLVGTEDGQIHKCSCSYTEQYLSSYRSHTAPVYAIEWSSFIPEVFLSCAADWTIKLWHVDRPTPFITIATHMSAVNDLAWSKKHAAIFACTNDSSLEIWNLETSTLDPVHIEMVNSDSNTTVVKFGEESDNIMVGDSLGNVYVYGMKNFPAPGTPPSEAAKLNGVLASCLSLQIPE